MRAARSSARSLLSALGLVAAAGLCSSADASDTTGQPAKTAKSVKAAGTRAPERLVLRTGVLREAFLVDAPDAPSSPAARENSDLADKAGVVPAPTAGFTLTGTVVIKAADADALAPILAAAKAAIRPFDGLPGYFLADAASVRAAAALADTIVASGLAQEAYVDVQRPQPLRDPNDPGFPQQWHLYSTLRLGEDLNVTPAWNAGKTGAGVTVAVMEDGWYTTHPDIAANFNAAASQTVSGATSHGTSVAGLVAAVGNNNLNGIGVAYGGKVSLIYRGSGAVNATGFTFRNDLNFVKTNSWGPFDNGLISYMTPAERDALNQAVTTGRSGKGTVVVWAAGNGGTTDRVDYDPYASSRYTIAVGSIDYTGTRSYFNESGSSMLVVTPSSNNGGDPTIVTTSGSNGFGAGFGGTSASAPEAAGVVALMLQANPNLSWRDVKHILVRSARHNDGANAGWGTNGAGRPVSLDYGFGAVNAAAAVTLAQTWSAVAPEKSFDSGVISVAAPIPDRVATGLTRTISVPMNLRVETVELILNVSHTAVGDLRVTLTSPAGTLSTLATPHSDPTDNYTDYVFTSARSWDELATGTWTIKIADEIGTDVGTWTNYRLKVYGSCAPDWDRNGAIEPADIAAFVQAWIIDLSAGTNASNFDADPAITPADIAAFVQAWLNGLSGGC